MVAAFEEAWAVHEALRRLGFKADDIYFQVGGEVSPGAYQICIVLRAQGCRASCRVAQQGLRLSGDTVVKRKLLRSGPGSITAYGEHFRGYRSIHYFVSSYPKRLVVKSTCHVGWTVCSSCQRKFKTDDKIWQRLPRKMWKLRLCTRCFRKVCRA